MNKEKISPDLLNKVSILTVQKKSVILTSSRFDETKKFLSTYNYKFKPYRFAQCFSVDADYEDLNIFSNLVETQYINPNIQVQASQDNFNTLHLDHLTKDKHLGQGETICFIDTGLYPHLDFLLPKCRVLKFIDFINHKTTTYDDNGHGTFVTGIAAGSGILKKDKIGISPLCNIISIKALDENGSSSSNTILDAMQWVYENHKVYNINTVCMSFGADSLDKVDPLSKGAESLWKIGITVVTAAGNSGPDKNTIKSPGNCPHVITVGALDTNEMKTAEFSSRGPTNKGHKPDLIAPAVNLSSTSRHPYPYSTMSGTSVATPIVAAVCANIKSKNRKISNNEIKKFLLSNCTRLTGEIDSEGAGFLNFENLTN